MKGREAPDRPAVQLSSLYQQLILEHYRKPRNRGELPEHTVDIHMSNPVCGDEIRLQRTVEDDAITVWGWG